MPGIESGVYWDSSSEGVPTFPLSPSACLMWVQLVFVYRYSIYASIMYQDCGSLPVQCVRVV